MTGDVIPNPQETSKAPLAQHVYGHCPGMQAQPLFPYYFTQPAPGPYFFIAQPQPAEAQLPAYETQPQLDQAYVAQAQFASPQGGSFYVPGNYEYMTNAFQSQTTIFPQAFHTMTLQDPSWNMDTGASSHLADNIGIFTSFSNSSNYPSVFVGNGHSIPVTHTGHSFLHTSSKPLQLNHILVTPHIIKNLIYVRKFTRDNDVSIEFDAYGFSVKDYQTQRLLLHCDITDDLYPVTQQPSFQTPVVLLSFSSTTWHRCLGHPGEDGLRHLKSPSNKIIISRHVRFDEDVFLFGNVTSSNKPTYDFILPPIQTTTNVPTTEPFNQHMDEPNNRIMPHPITPPTNPPQPESPPSHSLTPIQPQPDTHLSHSSTPIPTSAQTQLHAQMVDNHTPILINNSSQTMPTHPMVTYAKAGIFKPLKRMNCHVTTTSPLPRSHVHALRDSNWKKAMLDEYNALITNGTWVLVPHPANVNVVRSMWLFRHKFHADGSLSRYKAHLVANGLSQQQGIDCDETFSPVVKPTTIRTILSLAVSRAWPIHQLDVKNAFLHGHLSEIVYMHQPLGFVDPAHPDYVCYLQRSLYGLKQASRAWFQRFASYATRVSFQHSKTDSSLFIFHRGIDIAYLLLYVDDIILTASSTAFLQQAISSLNSEFFMTDLGSLTYFIGIEFDRHVSIAI
ncbi:ribonuclease H-like domain-containing protein [Tanacetum coccineum]